MATAIDSRLEDTLTEWLRDAHAMERQAEQVLEQTARRIEDYPELRARLEHHLQQTRRHADLVRACIERHDASTSAIKDTAASMLGFAQAASGLFVGDEVVKASLASFAFEEMEIAAYKILIAAAERCDDTETKRVCERILREEEEMADWLDGQLPAITRQYLSRMARGGAARR